MTETFWFVRLDEEGCGRTQHGNDRSVARRWKKVMKTGIRFANIMEKDYV